MVKENKPQNCVETNHIHFTASRMRALITRLTLTG